ncbi:MAG: hypothetical protein K2G37_06855 [Clostridia bacterium]|nr:hypothetical protein [Clostridia bacterium]
MKEKLRSYEFWVSIFSAVLVVLQTLSAKINIPHTTEIMTAFLGALCVVGIIKKKPSTNVDVEQTSNSNEEKEAQENQTQEDTQEEK